MTAELSRKTMALEKSNAELEHFAYVASHDLQEPLNLIIGYMDLLRDSLGSSINDDDREFMTHAQDGASRMKALIRDLLDYSRITSQGQPFEPRDFNDLLAHALHHLSRKLKDSGGEVAASPLPVLAVDPGQALRLLENLIGNAVKYRKPDVPPRIRVEARDDGADWVFSVRDNGIGVPPGEEEKIFAMFQRLHNQDEYEGTGIGLAVCQRIVNRHGGRLWVERNDGDGSTFLFTLPKERAQL